MREKEEEEGERKDKLVLTYFDRERKWEAEENIDTLVEEPIAEDINKPTRNEESRNADYF